MQASSGNERNTAIEFRVCGYAFLGRPNSGFRRVGGYSCSTGAQFTNDHRQVGRLKVELVSNGNDIAEKLLSPSKVLGVCDTELEIAVNDPEDVPDIVSDLVKGGARIRSVNLQTEDIEDIFLRLYNERN